MVPSFNPSVHGLRGLAASLVVLFHVWAGAYEGNFVPRGLSPAAMTVPLVLQYGVELFFMISGYLIAGSVMRHGNVWAFAKDRALRIYPPFLPLILLLFILGPLMHFPYFADVGAGKWLMLLIANLAFLPGVFPIDPVLFVAWTLSYEALFYVLSAAVYAVSRRSKPMATVLAVILAVVFCSMFPRATFFLIGVGIFLFPDAVRRMPSIVTWFAPLVLALLLASLFCVFDTRSPGYAVRDHEGFLLFFALAVGAGAVTFASAVKGEGPLSAILRSAPLQRLGTISYSLYLWHTPIMFSTKRLALKLAPLGPEAVFAAFALLSVTLALAISWLSYLAFERGRFMSRLPKFWQTQPKAAT